MDLNEENEYDFSRPNLLHSDLTEKITTIGASFEKPDSKHYTNLTINLGIDD